MNKEKIIKTIIVIILILVIGVIFIYKNNTKNNEILNEKVKNRNENEVNIYANEKNLPVLLEFSSTTCEPCKSMIPIMESIKTKYEDKIIVKNINIYEDNINPQKYNIRVVPTQIFLNPNGKIMYRHEGIFSENEIIEQLKKMGVN